MKRTRKHSIIAHLIASQPYHLAFLSLYQPFLFISRGCALQQAPLYGRAPNGTIMLRAVTVGWFSLDLNQAATTSSSAASSIAPSSSRSVVPTVAAALGEAIPLCVCVCRCRLAALPKEKSRSQSPEPEGTGIGSAHTTTGRSQSTGNSPFEKVLCFGRCVLCTSSLSVAQLCMHAQKVKK